MDSYGHIYRNVQSGRIGIKPSLNRKCLILVASEEDGEVASVVLTTSEAEALLRDLTKYVAFLKGGDNG